MIKIGVIGCGYWGPNLIRNFMELKQTWISDVCDLDRGTLEKIGARYPSLRLTTNYRAILDSPEIDAVAIATPVGTHIRLAKEALERGKHVLVEKPLATTARDAASLVGLARAKRRCLMVDHTFVYSEAVRVLKRSLGQLGTLCYVDSVRVNLGLFQQDINVLWDLAPHDVSILLHLVEQDPLEVSATGIAHINPGVENTAYLILKFKGRLMAHCHVNWLSPVKVRLTLIAGSKKMLIYDDLNPLEQVKVYDYGVKRRKADQPAVSVDYRMGDVYSPHVKRVEALRNVCADFAQSIRRGTAPVSDGRFGWRVVRILEAAHHSMKHGGRVVRLKPLKSP